jgi:hypothetical protein
MGCIDITEENVMYLLLYKDIQLQRQSYCQMIETGSQVALFGPSLAQRSTVHILLKIMGSCPLKVHKIEIFFGFNFEICIISLLVM